jgi:hypothetical protein
MLNHEYFEELCALWTVGQISEDEANALSRHLANCSDCRESEVKFRMTLTELVRADKSQELEFFGSDFGASELRKRFVDRAGKEGIVIGDPPKTTSPEARPPAGFWRVDAWRAFGRASLALSGAAALILAAYLFGVRARPATKDAPLASRAGSEQVSAVPAGPPSSWQREEQVRNELLALQRQKENSDRALLALRRSLDSKTEEARDLELKLHQAADSLAALEAKQRTDSELLADAKRELEGLRTQKQEALSFESAQQGRIMELSDRARQLEEKLDRERELLASDRLIRELMSARNLHIIDVHDLDKSGKNKKAFGRVFYTEGESLIFYAYDLGDPRPQNAKSFQVWGQQDQADDSARSLGILYLDDHSQRRWVLKVDDPELLREIDSVFVTVEPYGGKKQPSGKKLLYAFLNNQPNHP